MRELTAIKRTAERMNEAVLAKIAEPLVPPHKCLSPIEKHVTVLKDALAELRRLVPRPSRPRVRVRRPIRTIVQAVDVPRPMDDLVLPRDPGQLAQEISGCKLLLLEVIRRAAYDWVLYRSSRKLENRILAGEAYTWMFLEGPPHPDWSVRELEGKSLTSFESICLHLDLAPSMVRKYIKKLEARSVLSIGRPVGCQVDSGQMNGAQHVSALTEVAYCEEGH